MSWKINILYVLRPFSSALHILFAPKRPFHHSHPIAEVATWGGLFLTDEHCFSHRGCTLFLTDKHSFFHSGCVLFLTEKHRRTEHTAFHRGLAAGRYHRTLQPSLAVTLCELCMPEAFCGLETVRQKAPWTLCALWEIKLPSESHVSHLLEWVRSISHRKTQMNRTHKGAQRH